MYSRSISKNFGLRAQVSLASLGLFHKWGRCAKSCARISVCFWNQRGEGASIRLLK